MPLSEPWIQRDLPASETTELGRGGGGGEKEGGGESQGEGPGLVGGGGGRGEVGARKRHV
jgi:hypothetical protein